MKLRLYVPEPAVSVPLHNLFYFKWKPELLQPNVFGEPPFPNFFEEATYVNSVESADVIILPNNFNSISEESRVYIERYRDEAKKRAIPIYAFSFGDYSHEIQFPEDVRVFLMSTYKSMLRPTDVLVPTTARIFDTVEKVPRDKGETPLISFCGFGGFKTRKQWLKYHLKNAVWDIKGIFSPILRARKQGIYWRRRAMKALENSKLMRTNFIVRNSFSGAAKTIELSPDAARKEFIDSIVDADFVLAPKGDGNYSNRFLETLSLGRIPVLIDTDTPLPCESEIAYEKIIVRVPMEDVDAVAEYIRNFYDSLTNEEWKERQALARATFLTYLEQKQFFTRYFETQFQTSRQV